MNDEPPREKLERLMHVTFRMVGEAMAWPTKNVRGWLAIKTGHCDLVVWPEQSEPNWVPHSMSDMHFAELESFWEDARAVIRNEVLPHVDAESAEQIKLRLEGLE